MNLLKLEEHLSIGEINALAISLADRNLKTLNMEEKHDSHCLLKISKWSFRTHPHIGSTYNTSSAGRRWVTLALELSHETMVRKSTWWILRSCGNWTVWEGVCPCLQWKQLIPNTLLNFSVIAMNIWRASASKSYILPFPRSRHTFQQPSLPWPKPLELSSTLNVVWLFRLFSSRYSVYLGES